MRKILATISLSVLAASAALLCRCAHTSFAGGGTEDVNTRVTGMVFNPDRTPASHAQVLLIASDYDPVRNGHDTVLTDTTNEAGEYRFTVSKAGLYNAQIFDITARTRAIVARIAVGGETTPFPPVELSNPGAVKVMLPPNANTANGYMYIPGTTVFAYLRNSSGFVTLDSVPVDMAADIAYSTTNTSGSTVLRYGVQVESGDTAVVWNSGWKYSRKITLNTSSSGADVAGSVTDFPALIRLTGDNFGFAQARNNGEDIRFSKTDGSPLPYEIERWDAGTRQAEVWVKVDTVFGNDSAHSFIMYWGDSDATISSSGPAVFDTAEGFLGVWHLNQNCRDATGDQHDGVACSAADTAGLIGACKKFTHSDSIIIPGLLGAPQSITLSAWAQLDSTLGSGSEIISIGDAAFIRMDYPSNNIGTGGAVHLSDNDSVFAHVGSGKYLKQTGWHFITMTHSETTFATTVYIDGIIAGVRTDPNKPINYSGLGQNTCIGKHGNGKTGYDFYGKIDEARVYREAVSADYIRLCYMNQRQDDRLVVFK